MSMIPSGKCESFPLVPYYVYNLSPQPLSGEAGGGGGGKTWKDITLSKLSNGKYILKNISLKDYFNFFMPFFLIYFPFGFFP